jgi:hypothetical protein
MTYDNTEDNLTLQERAENHVYARLLAAQRELRQAEAWDGRGAIANKDQIEEIKQNQIIYAKRRVEVQEYILTKLYD